MLITPFDNVNILSLAAARIFLRVFIGDIAIPTRLSDLFESFFVGFRHFGGRYIVMRGKGTSEERDLSVWLAS